MNYKEVDLILVRSGIRRLCINCSKGTEEHRPKDLQILYPNQKGCCSGCRYLKEDGCQTMSLVCKLWLCSPRLRTLMNYYDRKRFDEITKIAGDLGWLEYRSSVEDYFK